MYISRSSRAWGQLLKLGPLALGIGLLGACETPKAPEWDVGVALPFATDPIGIADLLPSAVSVDTVNGVPVFAVALQTDGETYDLGQLCGSPCALLNGLTAPVPAFSYTDTIDVVFDADLVEIEIASATLGLSLNNGLNFDPLRPHPNPDSAGSILLLTRDAMTGALLDSTLLSGATQTLPPFSSLQVDINLTDVTVRDGLRTEVVVNSPFDGQSILIDTGLTTGFGISLDQIAVSAVTVVVNGVQLDESFALDVDSDFRDEVDDRVQEGSIELELTHDIEITGDLEVSIAGSAADLFSGDPLSEVRLLNFDISFAPTGRAAERAVTAAELQFIAAQPTLFVGYRGTASGMVMDAGRPTARVTPDQSIENKLKVIARVRVGG